MKNYTKDKFTIINPKTFIYLSNYVFLYTLTIDWLIN